eukprot:14390493-Ditylum_brightwellii.AAC.1
MAILQHLYATYGRITPSKLEENNRAMKKDNNAMLPIEHLTEQIKTVVTVAGNANYQLDFAVYLGFGNLYVNFGLSNYGTFGNWATGC